MAGCMPNVPVHQARRGGTPTRYRYGLANQAGMLRWGAMAGPTGATTGLLGSCLDVVMVLAQGLTVGLVVTAAFGVRDDVIGDRRGVGTSLTVVGHPLTPPPGPVEDAVSGGRREAAPTPGPARAHGRHLLVASTCREAQLVQAT